MSFNGTLIHDNFYEPKYALPQDKNNLFKNWKFQITWNFVLQNELLNFVDGQIQMITIKCNSDIVQRRNDHLGIFYPK